MSIRQKRGVFVQATRLGDTVAEGDLCGELLFPENPARAPIPLHFEAAGDVVCQRHPARVERGDCVAHLARPVSERRRRSGNENAPACGGILLLVTTKTA